MQRSAVNNSIFMDTPIGNFLDQTDFQPAAKSPENDNSCHDETRKPLLSTEPDFADPAGACHMIYWQDCIAQLAEDIRGKKRDVSMLIAQLERQNTASPCDFEFMKPQLVEYIFTVCVRLRLPNEVRFTAALILNTYLLRQLCSLREFVEKKELSRQVKQKEWENLETNVERQLPLRILTAIQISSKIHSYHDSISSRQVVNTLRKIGYPYTLSAVAVSEQRVFQMIGYKIPDSPLEACEMTVKVLTFTMSKRGLIKEEEYEHLWQHVLIVLDICYLNHTEVYNRFLNKCPHLLESDCERRLITAKFKYDVLLLASAVVQTAVMLSLGDKHMKVVAEIINRLLRCDTDYVDPLKQCLVEVAESKKDEETSECDIG